MGSKNTQPTYLPSHVTGHVSGHVTVTCCAPHQVNFSVKDSVPQDEYKAVLRRSGGSMEVLTNGDDTTEPSYRSVLC